MADLNSVAWDAVIVDEVHKIKDMKARTTKALREINTSRRFGLTGTALQNNLLEFWSILDWAQPGCLGLQADFVHEFIRPIESGQRHDANKRELAMARKQKDKLAKIRKTMMIRRLKSLIADQLPKKDDSVVFCKLSQLQTSIYQTILDQPGIDYVIHGDDPCSCDSGEPQSRCCKQKTPDGQSIRSLRFTFMHLLLKTSNHVALLIPTEKTSERQATTARKICEAALSKHPEFVAQTKEASFKTLSDPKYCGKMKILQGLLKVFYKEHSKTLVFSYSTQVLDIIEQHLMSTGYEYRRIDGKVSSKKRMIVVREFNKDPNIFICLISTKAYRIGQRRDVQVYRLISTGTIEENMYLRQIYKQQLLNVTVEDENARRYFYAVQGNRNQKGEIFGVKNMFVLRTGESCITRDIIKRNERVESALEGFDTAQYVSPVVRLEEDEEYEDVVGEGNAATENSTPSESEDLFAQFFSSSDESDVENIEREIEEIDSSDMEGNKSVIRMNSKRKHNKKDKSFKHKTEESVRDFKELKGKTETEKRIKFENKEKPKVRFQVSPKGKVKPSESRTGKAAVRRSGKQSAADGEDEDDNDDDNVLQYDQTLAGTFADVADVFDNCGVVHIHKNVKVVGGSRAEDHMSKCAISDVYELHQHSQDLAAQCEPMSESSEEEQPVMEKKRRGRNAVSEDHNTVRSTMVGNTKYLIGQTPKAFRLKYFEEMSKHINSGSLLDFAQLVLTSSLGERVKMLNRFYESKDPALQGIHKLKNYTPMSSETCREVKKSYSRSKYEKVQRKNEVGPRRTTPASSRTCSKVGQGVSFLDDIEPDSESLSQQSGKSDNGRPNSAESSMEVGRKVSPRKRVQRSPNRKLVKKCKIATKSRHEPAPSIYFEDYDSITEDKYRYGKKEETGEESVDSEDLLDEIGRTNEDILDDLPAVHKKQRDTQQFSVSSVLDDVFDQAESSAKLIKKPPPSKTIRTNSPTKRAGLKRKEKNENLSSDDDDDPFKIVDEIFNNNTDRRKQNKEPNKAGEEIRYGLNRNLNASKDVNEELIEKGDSDVNLEASTLKDDNYDCFDDPRLWKKRKRKEPDKRNAVDRLIDDSNADFDDLFTSGKMKKKASKSDAVNNRQNTEPQLDGSASLFS
ncbi:uncharacterized protein LOC123523704 isoform X2 [Mercenaria mercenaria]|uniref:uncharacterized protein LOC123523704 isoform X2 n=1 Tax=Mercenaria mercenaria TaxID=6596 RepID=UPI00234EFF3E|nr:uncharacterized protein LOC123523704 isoform X2 [Mercenaria mercenaria]